MKKTLIVSLLILAIIFQPTTASANQINTTKVSRKYPQADFVWKYLEREGFSDEVIAGIIGNMMAEVGGHTLNLKGYTKCRGYYGLCMWSRKYCPSVWGRSLTYQMQYLVKTMPKEFKNYGRRYKKGFTYQDFKALKDPQEVAVAFAKCYERCGSGSYSKRKKNAVKAYKYYHKS